MKKKTGWSVPIIGFVLIGCMLISIIEMYTANKIRTAEIVDAVDHSDDSDEAGDVIIWESVSHHFILFSR